MALQIAWNDPATKIALPACYGKIIYFNVDAIGGLVDVCVWFFKDAATAALAVTDKSVIPQLTMHFWPPIAAVASVPIPVNIATSLYAYLASQPVFAGSTNV